MSSRVPSYVGEGMQQALKYGSSTLAMAQKAIMEHCPKAAATAGAWAAENPVAAVSALVGAIGVTLIAAPGVFSALFLYVAGFGAGGVHAGTLAAAIQGGIGNVVAGTPFAITQSAGAGGAGLAVVNGVAQICGGVMTVGSWVFAWMTSRS